MTRIALINDDGTTTVGGVLCKLVPVEASDDAQVAGMEASVLGRASVDDSAYVLSIYTAMLAAATLDLSALPELPKRRQLGEAAIHGDRYPRAWGWNQAIDAIAPGSAPTEDV